MVSDITIIGAGPAGITAAVYAARAGFKVVIVEKNIYGGQSSIIENIENYPGFLKISGADFAEVLYKQAKNFGVEFVFGEAVNVDFSGNMKKIVISDNNEIISKSVIIANGLKRRTLGCLGEKEFTGRGVSYCATCDGAFFKNKSVLVVGGGNTALEDALYLSGICKDVTIIVRKGNFRGEKILVDSVEKTDNIKISFNSVVKEIRGSKKVESVVLCDDDGNKVLNVDGVFIAIGYQPSNEIYSGKIDINESGYFSSDENCETNVKGVYVAGDCRVKSLRQIATAVGDGAVAGNAAAAFVRNNF